MIICVPFAYIYKRETDKTVKIFIRVVNHHTLQFYISNEPCLDRIIFVPKNTGASEMK